MRTPRHCTGFLLALVGLISVGAASPPAPRFDEAAFRAYFRHGVATLVFPLGNDSSHAIGVRVGVEILDRKDMSRLASSGKIVLGPGQEDQLVISAPLDLTREEPGNPENAFAYRLSYRIDPIETGAFAPLSGLVSLPRVSPEFFKLSIDSPSEQRLGEPLEIRVLAFNPVTGLPVAGVQVEGLLDLEISDDQPVAHSVSDDHGLSVLRFPSQTETAEGVKVTGHLGDFSNRASDTFYPTNHPTILLSVDKPIYQPGQQLKARILVYSPGQSVLAHQEVRLSVSSEEQKEVFATRLETSEFGIADTEWTIPEEIEKGEYLVAAEAENSDETIDSNARLVSIRRYDLPNFVVQVEKDASCYLLDQPAALTVRAEYLSGKPVAAGTVRILRSEYSHGWSAQPGEALEVASGPTDGGVFRASLELAKMIGFDDNPDFRILDLEFTAYFTDASTDRVEERNFNLCAAQQPLLVDGRSKTVPRGLPVEVFLYTYHPDGTPASADVTVTRISGNDPARPMANVHTDRFGLAKVTLPPAAATATLAIEARDNQGNSGSSKLEIRSEATGWILRTPKIIHASGDPVEVEIVSNDPAERSGFLDVAGDDNVTLHSQRIVVRGGRLTATIPYQPSFSGPVTITAYASRLPGEPEVSDTQTIFFPKEPRLLVGMETGGARFKPRDTVTTHFQVSDQAGKPHSAALGFLVYDRAVTERSRVDQSTIGDAQFPSFLPEASDTVQLGDLSLDDLTRLDLARPAPPDLEMAAEFMAINSYPETPRDTQHATLFSSSNLFGQDTPFGRRMLAIQKGLHRLDREYGLFPANAADLDRMVGWLGLGEDALRDPWGNLVRPSFETSGSSLHMKLTSAGADEEFGVGDDPSPVWMDWSYFGAYATIIGEVLDDFQRRTGDSPHDVETFQQALLPAGIDFESLRDPWGHPYRVNFRFEQDREVTYIQSAGQNGVFDRLDDATVASFSWHYFTPTGGALTEALERIGRRTGKVVDDWTALSAELRREGIDPERLRDRWGRPFRFELRIVETNLLLILTSGGENGQFEQPGTAQSDDFEIWRSLVGDTFRSERTEIVAALERVSESGLPRSDQGALQASLARQGVELSNFVDYWKRPFQVELREESFTAFRIHLGGASPPASDGSIEPVREAFVRFALRSLGEDGVGGTADDFEAVRFSFPSTESPLLSPSQPPVEAAALRAMVEPESGALFGLVVDGSGASLPGVAVSVHNDDGSVVRTTASDENGRYSVPQLPPDVFEVDFELPGFRARQFGGVRLSAAVARQLDVALEVGGFTEMSSVITSQSVASLVVVTKSSGTTGPSAPVLRNYFPETLVWMPSLVTSDDGAADTKFQLADSVTTWKMEVLASTQDGRLAQATKSITAFLPFFVEFDPPPIWIQGDQIEIRPLVRNYLDKDQTVELSLKPEDWMSIGATGSHSATVAVPAGDGRPAPFLIHADKIDDSAKVRFTAISGDAADAIEKSVVVNPNGERLTESIATLAGSSAGFEFHYPTAAIPGSLKVELVLYPSLLSHAVEAANSLLQRPHGCAEQTLSIGFVNLMVLRAIHQRPGAAATAMKARQLIKESVDRLRAFQTAGGLAYWPGGEPSAVVTAYGLSFLDQAAEYVDIDPLLYDEALEWVLDSTPAQHKGSQPLDVSTVALLLSGLDHASSDSTPALRSFIGEALNSLEERRTLLHDPHVLALYALANLKAGRREKVLETLTSLQNSALFDKGQVSWAPAGGTAFYGWGLSGKVETTSLALRCFLSAAREMATRPEAPLWTQLALGAAEYLTTHKDPTGGWSSTQATVAALSALMDLAGTEAEPEGDQGAAVIEIDGRRVAEFPTDSSNLGPLRVDLSTWMGPGAHHVEIRRRNAAPALAHLVWRYFQDWSNSDAGSGLQAAGGFQLNVGFDKTEVSLGEDIECHVSARRHNWPFAAPRGMALVEISLPPGVEVERDSLEAERARLGWRLGKYEVAPDRVTAYLWPGDKPIDFKFRFRPRFRMNATTSASTLYDYYNPAARAKVAPVRFVVR